MKRGSFFGRLSRANDLAIDQVEEARDDVMVMEPEVESVAPEPHVIEPTPSTNMAKKIHAAPSAPTTPVEVEAEIEVETPVASLASTTSEESAIEDSWDAEVKGQLTIDVYQTTDAIVIKSTIAGVGNDELDISIDNDMVTIQGERTNCDEVQDGDYYYQECYWGSFSRSVILPCDVKAEEAEAELKNGILTITLPKANTTKAKKIEVKAS